MKVTVAYKYPQVIGTAIKANPFRFDQRQNEAVYR